MSQFTTLPLAPPDPILGLSEAFAKDPRPGKINLGVGVYKDAHGQTPILATVKKAEQRLLDQEKSKNYLPIDGSPAYNQGVLNLLFEGGAAAMAGRAVTAHTPGGTGGLRVAADFLAKARPGATVWLSDPTWPNHPQIMAAAGLRTANYPYYNAQANELDWAGWRAGLEKIPNGDIVLLHGCCHNPSGADPSAAQWAEIAGLCQSRQLLPLIDLAYQGFGDGLTEDAVSVRAFEAAGAEFLIASSFSKNFGLYNERVGALTAVLREAETATRVLSQVKVCIRANYSNPSSHGGAIVSTILGDAALRAEWEQELAAMRNRINGMRSLFVAALARHGAKRDFSFLTRQRGMFSFSGLNKDQVGQLRDRHAIYIVGSGRINVAGITESNLDRLSAAIAEIL